MNEDDKKTLEERRDEIKKQIFGSMKNISNDPNMHDYVLDNEWAVFSSRTRAWGDPPYAFKPAHHEGWPPDLKEYIDEMIMGVAFHIVDEVLASPVVEQQIEEELLGD